MILKMQITDCDIFFVASMKKISALIEIIIYVHLFLRAGKHRVLRIFILKWGWLTGFFFKVQVSEFSEHVIYLSFYVLTENNKSNEIEGNFKTT